MSPEASYPDVRPVLSRRHSKKFSPNDVCTPVVVDPVAYNKHQLICKSFHGEMHNSIGLILTLSNAATPLMWSFLNSPKGGSIILRELTKIGHSKFKKEIFHLELFSCLRMTNEINL